MENKAGRWCLLLLIVALCAVGEAGHASALAARTYYVSTTGSDSNPGTSAAPFRTITYAYSKVVAGDTILVRPGTYTDYRAGWALVLDKNGTASAPITLRTEVPPLIPACRYRRSPRTLPARLAPKGADLISGPMSSNLQSPLRQW